MLGARLSRWILRAALAAALAPCAGGAWAQHGAIVVGTVVSQTGLAGDLAAGYRKGILLWQSQLNAAGGLLGRSVEVRMADDQSGADAAAAQYRRLIENENADLLIGPYGSAASITSAAVAERAGRVMLNGSGASGAVHKRGLRYVFQVATPYAAYGAGVPPVARQWKTGRLFLIARADPVAREMADALAAEAAQRGLPAGPVVSFPIDTREFDAFVRQAQAGDATTWVAFGSARDAANMVITFKRLGYAPEMFVARGAEEDAFIRRVGQDAEQAIGIAAWTPQLGTAGNQAFVRAYRERWSVEPDLAAAQGYSAGRVLEAAVRQAGSLDQERLRAVLERLEMETPLGRHRTEPGTGRQLANRAVLVQVQKGRHEVIWPAPRATASARLPYLPWDRRTLITAGE
ncbi:MAG: ABC transporter substrate-binding protein [Burkholderiales bacterium]|nr:ABC transporter substrate-binding protein [Burkholderiales bacterium]